MKIGIVGLKPKQIADLNSRSFGQILLSFFEDGKKMTPENLEIFARHHDRVLVLYPHVPKHAVSRIPASKVHGMSGSVSTLIRYFETLKITQVIEDSTPSSKSGTSAPVQEQRPPLREEKTIMQPPPVAEEELKPVPPNKLGSMVPKGYTSQYRWDPNLTVLNPRGRSLVGSHSYELLDIAEPGDVVRYGRPPNIEFEVWKQRLTTMRGGRLKSKQQLLEIHFFDTYVDIMVMKQNVQSVEATPTVKDAPVDDSAESSQTQVKAHDFDEAMSKAVTIVESDVDRVFWKQVYVASLGQSGDNDKALSDANLALDRYRERFPALHDL